MRVHFIGANKLERQLIIYVARCCKSLVNYYKRTETTRMKRFSEHKNVLVVIKSQTKDFVKGDKLVSYEAIVRVFNGIRSFSLFLFLSLSRTTEVH